MKLTQVQPRPSALMLLAAAVSAAILLGAPNSRQPAAAATADSGPQEQFIRLAEDASGAPKSLEIAVSTYRPARGDLEITLVGAVHFADKEYFEALNAELKKHDAVLYELVAPKNSRPQRNAARAPGLLASFQSSLSEMLDVTHQLDAVDYQQPHFIHADLSFDELMAEGKRRGETASTIFLGMLLDTMRMMERAEQEAARRQGSAAQGGGADAFAILSDPGRLRREFARILVNGEIKNGTSGFSTLDPYIIGVRNDAAMKVLDAELAKGKRRIAIFYGAAHLPDFERRLIDERKMQLVETRWLSAWDLQRQVPEKSSFQLMMRLLSTLQQPAQSNTTAPAPAAPPAAPAAAPAP